MQNLSFGTFLAFLRIMKRLLFVFFSLLIGGVYCQNDTIHIRYFPSGKVSTIQVLEDQREGFARAYNQNGEVIYEANIRRFAGHASVQFTHYKNDAVKTAHYSSAPDGGIQWYRVTTEFSEDGEVTKETKDSHENLTLVEHMAPEILKIELPEEQEKKTKKSPPNKEVSTCARIHQNKIKLINHSRFTITYRFIYQNKESFIKIKPGETKAGIEYISAEITSSPKNNVNFDFKVHKKWFRSPKQVEQVVTYQKKEELLSEYTFHLFESSVNRNER